MVFYQNRVRNKFNNNNNLISGGVKRNISCMKIGFNYNNYIVGSGVGSINSSNRSALNKRAKNCCINKK